MRRLLPALAASLLLVAACGDDGSTQDRDETFDPGVDADDPGGGNALPGQIVVFGPDEVEADVYGEPVTWTPSAEDVAAVEEILAAHLRDEAATGVDELTTYARQYVGVGEAEDRLTVNALCAVDDLPWEDDLVLVNDGGPCFWQATVDPATGTVDPFTVNGEA